VAGVVAPGPAEHAARLADTRSAKFRQTRLFMLFRRNVSVCTQSLEGLYFYRVHSPPASHDGSAGPTVMDPGMRRGGGEDVTPDADGSSVRRG
jgi:hypothetical protein